MGRATTTLKMSTALLVLVVLSLSGCASAPVDTGGVKPWVPPATSATAGHKPGVAGPAPAQAAGSTVVTDPENGFSVTLPAGYVRITDKAQLDSLMKAASKRAGAKIKAAMAQYGSLGSRARVFAIRIGATDFADNLNILVMPAAGADAEHFGDLYDQLRPTLEKQLGATITGHKVEAVAGTKALRIEYRLPVGQQSVRGTQVYLLHNGRVLVSTITQSAATGSAAEANMIVDSLRFI
jgi:hypothetical protein